ncbi:toxin TcdB middle/N-terminal domain-containing protein [Monashia sp. NPDC004114]
MRVNRRQLRAVAFAVSFGFLASSVMVTASPAEANVLAGLDGKSLVREEQVTPEALADGLLDGLQYADPTAGLAMVDEPEANPTGNATVAYPLAIPQGRGITPDLQLTYDSGARSSWVGYGWDLNVGEVSVDTTFGVPLFCPRQQAPICGNVESETYRLDGDLLAPTAARTDLQARAAERSDFTRKVETQTDYEHIIRHGDNPQNYFWEVRDKSGGIRWYGGFPDEGGPFGDAGTRHDGPTQDDRTQAGSAIAFDDNGNAVTWYLKAQRDVGVNTIRYEYDTVRYRSVDTESGVQWQVLAAGQDCPSGAVCGRHVYLSKIFYTGAAEVSNQPEAPAYEVDLIRGARRADPVVDARGGYVDVDVELLTQVKVTFHKPGGASQLAMRYDLDNHAQAGPFGKTLLRAVSQVGCATGPACDDSTKATHRFSYFDELDDSDNFQSSQVDVRGDGLAGLEGRASSLGMSDSIGGDGHLYVGFNPEIPLKEESFGGSLTFAGSDTKTTAQLMDLNGDNLPDKVFHSDKIRYRLNTTRPGAPLTFADDAVAPVVPGLESLDSLGSETSLELTGGLESYVGPAAMFHAGGSWNWSDRYFTDVNADGLPDFVDGNTVLYNRLDCSTTPCTPTFSTSDAGTRVPLNVRDLAHDTDTTEAETLALLKSLAPPIDNVRRWRAPFDGTVKVSFQAIVPPVPTTPSDCAATNGIRLAVQRGGTELATCSLDPGQHWSSGGTLDSVPVTRGQFLYFRVGPDLDLPRTAVTWNPQVTYVHINGLTDQEVAAGAVDVNGLDQTTYDAAEDFTTAGRPNSWVSVPQTGLLRYSGVLDKQPTTDFVRPTVEHVPASTQALVDVPVTLTPVGADAAQRVRSVEARTVNGTTTYCVVTPATTLGCFTDQATANDHRDRQLFPQEAGAFTVSAEVQVTGPTAAGNGTQSDRVRSYLKIDSPVDPTRLHWATPLEICYSESQAAGGPCIEGSSFRPPVDTEIYPIRSVVAPQRAYAASASDASEPRTVRVAFNYALPSDLKHPAGTVVVTVKGSDGSIAKDQFTVPANDFTPVGSPVAKPVLDVSLTAGVAYVFDVTVREPGLFRFMRNGRIELETGKDSSNNPTFTDVTNPYGAFNATGNQGWLPLDHRGWAVVGYRADGSRRTDPIVESKLALPVFDSAGAACQALAGGPCPTGNSHANIPSDYPTSGVPEFKPEAVSDQFQDAYPFNPAHQVLANGQVREAWQGPQDSMQVSAAQLLVSRLGRPLPQATPAGTGGIDPPKIQGGSKPTLALTLGPGPLALSLGAGWGDGDSQYLDMNGDRFPDVVTDSSITFTDPRGGHACVTSLGPPVQYAACKGGGPGTVSSDFSVSFNAGISGSPSVPRKNAEGKGDSTTGGQSNRGQSGQTDLYGAKIGAGISLDGSWTAPIATDPSWDTEGDPPLGQDFSDLPGSGPGDGDLQLQRQLADVNGDGLPDKVSVNPNGVFVAFNRGYGFTGLVKWTGPSGFEAGESYSGSLSANLLGFAGYFKDFSGGISRAISTTFPRYTWVDVNGDGILDALHKGSSAVHVGFGSGSGVLNGAKYGDHARVDIPIAGDVGVDPGPQVRQQSSVTYGAGFDFTVAVGPLCLVACYLIINPGAHLNETQSISDVDLVDVNGDGYADSVSRKDENGSESLEVGINRQGKTGLLKSVENPLGGRFDLDYTREGNTVEHPDSIWVMSDVQVDDGRPGDGVDITRTTYTYGTPRYDFVDREDLGFDEVVARESTPGGPTLRTTKTSYSNGSIWEAGLERQVEVHAGDVGGPLLTRTTNTWAVLDGPTQQPIPDTLSADDTLKTWATALMTAERHQSFESGGVRTTETSYVFDRLGNPTTIVDRGDTTDGADDVVAEIAYSTCDNAASDELKARCGNAANPGNAPQPPFWSDNLCPTWTSLPAIMTIRDANGAVLRHRDGSQDLCDNSSVTLLRELVSGTIVGGSYAETRLAYDAWGSYNRIIEPRGENGKHYAVLYRYDPDRRSDVARVTEYELAPADLDAFLGVDDTETTDQFDPQLSPASDQGLETSATFDGPSGQVASRTDSNGQTTSYSYDALGRPASTTFADGGRVLLDYDASNPAYAVATARNSDQFHPGEFIETVSFADGIGRRTQQKQEIDVFAGFDQPVRHGFAVSGTIDYDALGRVVREAQPTFGAYADGPTFTPPSASTPATTRTWDLRDRMLSETLPGDRTTSSAYDAQAGLGTTLLRKRDVDPLGRQTVTFTDLRDYVRMVDDVAVGEAPIRTSYSYDRMGQLLAVTSAGRDQERSTWDLLGRRTSTDTEDGGLVAYGYDAAGQQVSTQTANQRAAGGSRTAYHFSFGHLVSVDYPDGTGDESYAWGGYDGVPTTGNAAGRVARLKDAARSQAFTYDALGRVATETTEMVDADWKLGRLTTSFTQDWLGRLATLTYPDGEVVTHGYDHGGQLDRMTGAKACRDVGVLTADVSSAQTTITVTETPHAAAPALPFLITIQGEQLRVTGRASTANPAVWTYTVDRGINGTPAAPTAAAHPAGARVLTDAALQCSYRYLDRAEHDVFGAPQFQQVGNGNRTQWLHDPLTRLLTRQVTTAPAQPLTGMGTLAAPVTAAAPELVVNEAYTPPMVPFVATIGTEKVRVTGRAPTATSGQFRWTVERGSGGTTASAYVARSTVFGERMQQNLAYSYDKADNIRAYVNDLPPDVPSLFGGKVTQIYDYDGHYRVTAARGVWQEANNTRFASYDVTYDASTGNTTSKHQRVWEEKVGCKKDCVDVIEDNTYDFTDVTFQADHQHQLATQGGETFTHDLDGNISAISSPENLREMTWNARDKLTMVIDRPNGTGGKPTFYTYDYKGEVAKEDKEQGRTWFVNQWVTVKAGTVWKNYFAGDERLAVKFSQDDVVEQKVYFLHKDVLGGTNIATDRAAVIFQHQEYLPTGEPWVAEDSTVFRTPYQFSGEYTDEDHGLVDFGQRWFEPRGGFFLSTDPLLNAEPLSLIDDPALQSTYALAEGNPVTYFDRDGWVRIKKGGVYLIKIGGVVRRTGRATDFTSRASAHRRAFGQHITFKKKFKTNNYAEQRGLEHYVYMKHAATANLNMIGAISKKNKKRNQYIAAGRAYLVLNKPHRVAEYDVLAV